MASSPAAAAAAASASASAASPPPPVQSPPPPPQTTQSQPQSQPHPHQGQPQPQSIFPQSHVGFDSITSQIERKLLKRGFQFNVMCVGQTGLGKSTLINTIFATHLIDSKGRLEPNEPVRQTTEIQTVSHVIEENGVRLRLNIVDTPGYGDQVNNDRCWDPIVKYIKDQHSAYLRKELHAQRDRYIADTRIHCCLFFIQPSGHALKPIDIVVLKKLSDVVNVVPVIAKSDSLTLEERQAFKERIKEEFEFHNLRMYPYDNEEFDSEERAINNQIKSIIPFAVVGSEKNIIVDGKQVRGRQNRWGVINVEDENHCEFVYLRNFLTRTHLQDLIETTSQIHYETFRAKQLMALRDSTARPTSPSADRELSRNSQRMTMTGLTAV
ncbi:septin [Ascosphaera apis ARSEF 7405]|uniref:Septin n=1 Tax=Ascosphaera apis ARSEF 7405 TaxID=392613 RepID=A0A168CZ70_9EURO|nr:septin [Ascosphaera apis ARSEF 7405]